jgi:hypothetical protein
MLGVVARAFSALTLSGWRIGVAVNPLKPRPESPVPGFLKE